MIYVDYLGVPACPPGCAVATLRARCSLGALRHWPLRGHAPVGSRDVAPFNALGSYSVVSQCSISLLESAKNSGIFNKPSSNDTFRSEYRMRMGGGTKIT